MYFKLLLVLIVATVAVDCQWTRFKRQNAKGGRVAAGSRKSPAYQIQQQQEQQRQEAKGYGSSGAPQRQRPDQDEKSWNSVDEGANPEPPIYGGVMGTPGVDFPAYTRIPATSFKCADQPYSLGMYADMETQCQSYHVCHNGRKESFLCGTGTVFNQAILGCDYWHAVDCSQTPNFYSVNEELGKSNSEPSSQQKSAAPNRQPPPSAKRPVYNPPVVQQPIAKPAPPPRAPSKVAPVQRPVAQQPISPQAPAKFRPQPVAPVSKQRPAFRPQAPVSKVSPPRVAAPSRNRPQPISQERIQQIREEPVDDSWLASEQSAPSQQQQQYY